MRIHNRSSKQRAVSFGKPVTNAGDGAGKGALDGQRDLSEQIWARWREHEQAEKERDDRRSATNATPVN